MRDPIGTLTQEITVTLEGLLVVNTNTIRQIRREFSTRLRSASSQFVIQLASRLLRRREMAYRIVAYELIHYHTVALRSLKGKELERLGKGLDSWGAVDMFACYLAGPAWRQEQVSDDLIGRWARSEDRWWRRAALVSTVPLNSRSRGGKGDAPRTLRICRMLAQDRDDMVVKAMSWALRELAKRDPATVRSFTAKYKDQLPPRVLREVHNKLETGRKNLR